MYTNLEKQLKIMIQNVAPSVTYPRYCEIVNVNNSNNVDVLVNIGEPVTLHNILNIGNPIVNNNGVLIPINGSWKNSVCISNGLEESKFKYINSLDEVNAPSSDYLYFLINNDGIKLYVYYNGFKTFETGSVDLTDYYTKTIIDNLLVSKADKSTTYTKTEVDKKISDAGGADLSDYYKKSETNNLLNAKVNIADYSTDKTNLQNSIDLKANETEVTSLTSRVSTVETGKANVSDVYSRTESDSLLSKKSDTSHTHKTTDITDLSTTLKDYATTSSVNTLLADYAKTSSLSSKADKSDTYTKTEVDDLISGGGTDLSNYYNKTETNNLLNSKSNTGHTHTTSEITNLSSVLSGYATDSELSSGLSGKANSRDRKSGV